MRRSTAAGKRGRAVAGSAARRDRSRPEVIVKWRKIGTPEGAAQTARDIAETVTGYTQRRLDAPRLNPVGELRGGIGSQSDEPLTYYVDGEKVVGYQWTGGGAISFVLASGEVINGKSLASSSETRMFEAMKPSKPRAKSKINIRPGKGGNARRPVIGAEGFDPTEGLEEYAPTINWESRPGGASVAVIELDPEGNTVILCRLSNEDDNQRLVLQVDPCMALARQHPEILRVRKILLAVNMSGAREVRPNRAGPPPPGELERDDMVLLDEWIAEGWVEHVIARGADRLAREMLPGETLIKRWAGRDIGLWLARQGRRMDYEKDRSLLRLEMFMSAEERAAIAARCQNGLMEKGPLAGVGWLGTKPFGFVREKYTRRLVEDPEQWPFILRTFELADFGCQFDESGLSYRKIRDQLEKEGCPFDEERIRKILHDPIYASGEFTVTVRGVTIPQTRLELQNPVPLDRWQRVQTLLALRQGKTSRTPLGEFIFNHVETVHVQCEGQTNCRDREALIKGYLLNAGDPDIRRYRHSPFVPDCCKRGGRGAQGSFTWERDEIEVPVIEAVRELASHPELVAALVTADEHRISSNDGRLSDAQRQGLDREIGEMKMRIDAATEEFANLDPRSDGESEFALFKKMIGGLQRKLEALEARRSADDHARSIGDGSAATRRNDRVVTFLDLMTTETPEDAWTRAMRARLFQRVISRVEIDDSGSGPITITLHGHLVPDGASLDSRDPIAACADLLDSMSLANQGKTPAAEAELARLQEIETALPDRAEKAVSSLLPLLPSLRPTASATRLAQQLLSHEGWRFRPHDHRNSGTASWRKQIRLPASGQPARRW